MRKAFFTLLAAFLLVSGFCLLAYPNYVQAAIEEPSGGGGGIPELVEYDEGLARGKKGEVNSAVHNTSTFTNLQGALGCALGPELVGLENCGSEGTYSMVVNLTETMFNSPPANTGTYVADLMQNMNLGAEPVYAQGIGFSALEPILGVWKTMRNISYFLFIIIFLAIGFMIMFRQKIGGQAAVTAQQAIPRIVVALILVTFSYAIAGLMIDIMYLTMFAIAGLFSEVGGDSLIHGNVFSLTFDLISNFGDAADAIGKFVADALGGPGIVKAITKVISGLTAAIIILVVLLFNAFKLFFKLLRVYVEIIIQIAFAPLLLMMGAIPGRNTFGPWIKSLFANLAVFPMILIIVAFFKQLNAIDYGGSGGFNPPYISGAGAQYLPFLVGLALILALPEAVDQVRKALGASEGGMLGGLIRSGMQEANNITPLTNRLAGAGVLGGANAIQAGARRFVSQRNVDMSERWLNTRKAASEGFTRGARRGVGGAAWLARSTGANAPDILSPVISGIDQRYNPESARRERLLQTLEDASQRIGTGGVGRQEEAKEKGSN